MNKMTQHQQKESQQHRVVVQLIKSDIDEDYESIPQSLRSAVRTRNMCITQRQVPLTFDDHRPEVEIIDLNTLLFNIGKSDPMQMNFDCVGNASDCHILNQSSMLLQKLYEEQRNCALIRFNVVRECQSKFLCNRLFREMDHYVNSINANMISIHMEYFDIRKYEVVKMLAKQIIPVLKGTKPDVRLKFSSILQLIRWFQRKYNPIWAAGFGHEFFEFTICFQDKESKTYNVKLNIMVIYLNKMDFDTKNSLFNYWDGTVTEKKVKYSMVTDCLKEFYSKSGMNSWHTWNVFNIPLLSGGGMVIEDMLMLANSANNAMKCICQRIKDKADNISIATTTSNQSVITSKSSSSKTSHLTNNSKISYRTIHSYVPSDNLILGNYNTLTYWYTKIDDVFNETIIAMEDFYTHITQTKIQQMCEDIQTMMHHVDIIKKPSGDGDLHENSRNMNAEDLTNFKIYKNSIENFKSISNVISKTPYESLLQVHLKTKTFDLQRRVIRFKTNLLEKYQSYVANAIKKEMSTLSNIKITPMNVVACKIMG